MKQILFIAFLSVILGGASLVDGQVRQNNKRRVALGDVTKKAVYLPAARLPFNIQFPPNTTVRVRVEIDLLTGKVTAAKAVSGLETLRAFAEDAARCARFVKTNDAGADGFGFIEYRFSASNRMSLAQVNGGVLNGKAIHLPKPVLPADSDLSGVVSVRVQLDEQGAVISAKAVSGNPCLGEAAEEAARQAKFTRTLLSGVPVKVAGIVVYNFPPKNR